MPRTVNPEQHAARRAAIIDAALNCFARTGFERATTAQICREAGIGSGTFFHYFPTKLDVLLAVLEFGTAEIHEFFAQHDHDSDGLATTVEWLAWMADQLSDPRAASFVTTVSSLLGRPEVTAALAADEATQLAGLTTHLARAQAAGSVRTDLSAERLATWVILLVDGFTARIATTVGFDPTLEKPVLLETVSRFLREPG